MIGGLPHCVAYESGSLVSQRVFRRVMESIEGFLEPMRAVGLDPANIPPEVILTVPFVGDMIEKTYELQARMYDGKQTAKTLLGHATTQQIWQHYRWRAHGRRVYELSASLVAGLAETEIHVAGSDILAPFPTYYMRVRDLGLGIDNIKTGEHELDGFYVTHVNGGVVVLAVGAEHVGCNVDDDALASYAIQLGGIDDVEQWISGKSKDQVSVFGIGNENADRMVLWTRLVLGFCLYMQSPGFDAEKRKLGPTDSLRAKAKKIGGKAGQRMIDNATLPVHYVRVGFKHVDNNLVNHAKASDETRALTKRHVVRGHYRNQAHGPGRTDRRIVFIKAHWKGPPWGDVVGGVRVHVVE